MLKKLLLSTLIILGIVASTQAQSFDFDCEEEETIEAILSSDSIGSSSYNLDAETLVIGGEAFQNLDIEDFTLFHNTPYWQDDEGRNLYIQISLADGNEGFIFRHQDYALNKPVKSEPLTFEELIAKVEEFRPATYSNNHAQYTAATNKLVVQGIEFVSNPNGNEWSAPYATLPCSVDSYVIRDDFPIGLYFRYDIRITYNDGTPITHSQSEVVDWTNPQDSSITLHTRKANGFNQFFSNDIFDKSRFYSTDCTTFRLSANTSYSPLANDGRGSIEVDGFEFIPRHGDTILTYDSPAGFAISGIGVEYLPNSLGGDFKVTHYGRFEIYATFAAAVDQIRALRTIDPNP